MVPEVDQMEVVKSGGNSNKVGERFLKCKRERRLDERCGDFRGCYTDGGQDGVDSGG